MSSLNNTLSANRLLRFPADRPWVVIAAVLVVTALLVPFAGRVVIDPSIERVIEEDDPDRVLLAEVEREFGSDNTIFILLRGPDSFTPGALRRIDRVTRSIETIEGVRRVVSLSNVLRIRGTAEEIEIAPLIDMGRLEPGLLEEARRAALASPLYHRNLVSTDGRTTCINVFLRSMTDPEYYDLGIGEKIEWILESEARDVKAFIAGIPYAKQLITRYTERDESRFAPMTLLLIAGVLVFFFRSFKGVFLPLLTITLCIGWTVGLMGLLGEPMTLISTALPPLLMAVGSAYGIHVLAEHRDQSAHGGDKASIAARTMERVGLPVILTGLTTIVGFASLALSGIPAIRALGLYCSFGLLCATIISITLVPALLSLLGPRKADGSRRKGSKASGAFLERLARFDVRRRRAVLAVSAVLILAGSAGIGRLRVDLDMISFFKEGSPLRETKRLFHEELAGAAPLFLVIEGGGPGAFEDPELLGRIEALQLFLEAFEEIDSTTSVVDYIKVVNRALGSDDPEEARVPDTRGEVAEELLLLSMSGEAEALGGLISEDRSRANILLRTDIASSASSRAVISEIDRYLETHFPAPLKARLIGTQIIFNRTANALAVEQVRSLSLALVVIFAMMTVLFRSIRIGLLSMVPNLIPILLFFGIMGWAGMSLNITTSMIACVVLGIAVDDTIHLLSRFRAVRARTGDMDEVIRTTLEEVGRPITITTTALCLGFSVFAFSSFQPLVSFGLLSAVTLAICLLADLVLLPALLAIVVRPRG